ncbi:phosphoglycolate phosphatase [Thalassobaculum fulvum]|uniref:Phosphoglycolate phosphatase n=1 Tax=Thalassobaculum fulvum TaxID=1633335 RepID=A0A919CPR8_9PROT|nr:HAD-IA family hydrolase [Thalassobaculum fulvum]GHD51544.1 phosphoglycolate phosphatase [Thalassobaculum fulvum]
MLLIFDVDGTLVDSRAMILECARRTFADGWFPHPGDAAFLATIGLLPDRMMERLFPDRPEPERLALAARYVEAVKSARRERPDIETPYPGIDGLLAAVDRAGFALGIATGKRRPGVDHMLDTNGWHGLFRSLQTAESGPGKPDPTLIRNAMAETGHAPEATVMIGDSVFDMQMARAAGVTAIGVGWGYNALDALSSAGAHHIVAGVPALRDLLLGLDRNA